MTPRHRCSSDRREARTGQKSSVVCPKIFRSVRVGAKPSTSRAVRPLHCCRLPVWPSQFRLRSHRIRMTTVRACRGQSRRGRLPQHILLRSLQEDWRHHRRRLSRQSPVRQHLRFPCIPTHLELVRRHHRRRPSSLHCIVLCSCHRQLRPMRLRRRHENRPPPRFEAPLRTFRPWRLPYCLCPSGLNLLLQDQQMLPRFPVRLRFRVRLPEPKFSLCPTCIRRQCRSHSSSNLHLR